MVNCETFEGTPTFKLLLGIFFTKLALFPTSLLSMYSSCCPPCLFFTTMKSF